MACSLQEYPIKVEFIFFLFPWCTPSNFPYLDHLYAFAVVMKKTELALPFKVRAYTQPERENYVLLFLGCYDSFFFVLILNPNPFFFFLKKKT